MVQVIETSAPQRQGLQELEEALLLQAEMQALLASPSCSAEVRQPSSCAGSTQHACLSGLAWL